MLQSPLASAVGASLTEQSGVPELDCGPFKDAPFITLQDQRIENDLLRKV